MTDEERDDLLARADVLNHKLEAVPFEQMLRQYNKQRSQLQMLLALVVALVLVVTVQIVVTVQVYRNARRVEALCRTRPIWDFILTLPPSAPRSTEQERQLAELRLIVAEAYADCPAATHL